MAPHPCGVMADHPGHGESRRETHRRSHPARARDAPVDGRDRRRVGPAADARHPELGADERPPARERGDPQRALDGHPAARLRQRAGREPAARDAARRTSSRSPAPIAAGLREVANRNAPKVLGSAAALPRGRRPTAPPTSSCCKILERRRRARRHGDAEPARPDRAGRRRHRPAGRAWPTGCPQNLQQLQVLKTDKLEAAQKAVQTAQDAGHRARRPRLPAAGRRGRAVDRPPPHGRRHAAAASSSPACSCWRCAGSAATSRSTRSPRPRTPARRSARSSSSGPRCSPTPRGASIIVRPVPGHGRLADRPGAARDGAAPRERPGAARAPGGLPRRARLPASCCSCSGARCRGRTSSGPC